MLHWFQRLCRWLESEAESELYTLTELHAKMVKFSGGSDVKRLKHKMNNNYEEFIFFADVEGRGTVLCLHNN